jgi:FKBP-type peptidyl-prolyl cis-trans isomerase
VLEDGRVDCNPSDPLKIVKTIKKEGISESATPPLYSTVYVHYVGTLEDGRKFDSSRDRGTVFHFKTGRKEVIKGWEYGVSTMKQGEIAQFTISSEYAYGEKG